MSDWRARRDADGVRPASVSLVVRRVYASLRAAHAAESCLFFLAGALVARCALLTSGTGQGSLLLVLLCGALCAATWWLEHPVRLQATARALDGRLRHNGALATAFDLEQRSAQTSALGSGALTPMAELVRVRVLERLRVTEAVRALWPPLGLPIAAPLIGFLLLILVVDARSVPAEAEVDFRALASGLRQALADGVPTPGHAGEADAPSQAWLEELRSALAGQHSLPSTPEQWGADPEGARVALERLDRRLARLSAEAPLESEIHERLNEARTWLDALRMGLETRLPSESGGDAHGSGPGATTGGPSQGTISGSIPGPRPAAGAGPASPSTVPMPTVPMSATDPLQPISAAPPGQAPAPALGLQSGSWWPEEYDAVVQRWFELRGPGTSPR